MKNQADDHDHRIHAEPNHRGLPGNQWDEPSPWFDALAALAYVGAAAVLVAIATA